MTDHANLQHASRNNKQASSSIDLKLTGITKQFQRDTYRPSHPCQLNQTTNLE